MFVGGEFHFDSTCLHGGCAVILPVLAWLLIRLDLYFRSSYAVIGALVLMSGPLLAMVATTLQSRQSGSLLRSLYHVLVPFIFALHAALIICIGVVAQVDTTTIF